MPVTATAQTRPVPPAVCGIGHTGLMLYSTILAGGSGTRLWPLSRASQPKFLHPLTGTGRTLLQATADRITPLSAPGQVYVVTGTSHAAAVARQLPAVPAANILVEPSPRDSCAAVSLAAAVLAGRDPAAVMAVFSADHLIGDERAFTEVIKSAAVAARAGYLVTVGVKAVRPDPRFGYLHVGEQVQLSEPAHTEVRLVAEFKEKPTPQVAVGYLESGGYLWNAGMFVFMVQAYLAELARQKPALHAGVMRVADARGTPEAETVMAQVWPTLEKISVDYAVMEGAAAARKVATVPADFPWSDVGDFDSLGESLAADDAGNLIIGSGAPVTVLRDVKDAVIVSDSGRVIAAIGMDDVVIADTKDALLVCPRSRAQEVKQIVDQLKERGADEYL